MDSPDTPAPPTPREWLRRVIFHTDTRAGRVFDVVLLWLIVLSVLTLALESVEEYRQGNERLFLILEWSFTALFTLEYLARLWVAPHPVRYARSFFGVVDLLSVLPSYISLLIAGTHYLMALRVLRLMRMFRILKMAEYLGEASSLLNALAAGRRKILVFLTFIMTLVLVEGTIMYVLEHDHNEGFANIPQSIYWAIVTITTVGYGDAAPITVAGKMMASVIMLTGFAILAVPTGIMTYEIGREMGAKRRARQCRECGWREHDQGAHFCQQCGVPLE